MRIVAVVCLVVSLAAGARGDLKNDIQTVLGDKLLSRAKVGVEIVQLGAEKGGDRLLYGHDAQRALIPASNMKVLTTSAALEILGADFKFRTVLARRDEDLILIGDGDPSFGDAELLKKHDWSVTTVFQQWAEQLRKAEMTKFHDVLVDDSVFDQEFVNPHWPPEQEQSRYVAQVCGMALNANCIDFYVQNNETGRLVSYRTDPPTKYVSVYNSCVGGGENAVWLTRRRGSNQIVLKGSCRARSEGPISVTIHDPALYAGAVLAETLAAGGIKLDGVVGRDRTVRAKLMRQKPGSGFVVLAVHETPIASVLARANKDSMNLYGESLCKRIGFAAAGESGSWENGTAAVGAFLKKLGAAEQEFNLDDGCGLSRQNAVSTHTMCLVLAHNFHGRNRTAFMESLAVGGEDGTLQKRFRQPNLRGKIFAKTGYIANVSALSGYLKAGETWYAFSILMNNLPAGSNSRAKTLQEEIVRAIANQGKGKG